MKAYRDDYENIAVPMAELDAVVNRAILKGNRHVQINKCLRFSVSAAIIGLIFLGSGFMRTTVAKVLVNIPFVGSVFESFADEDLANLKAGDLTKLEDMQITANGITVAIKEVYYDQSNISVAYLVSGAGFTDEKHFDAVLLCEGMPISGGGSGGYSRISDKLYSGLVKYYPAVDSSLPDQFDLGVILTDNMEKAQESPYRFTIPVSRSQADEKTRSLVVMKAAQSSSGDHILLVKKVVFTPVSTLVEYEYTHPNEPGKPGQSGNEITITLPSVVKTGIRHLFVNEIPASQGIHRVKLFNASKQELSGGSLSWHVDKNDNSYTNKCRAYFGASNEAAGDWTLELVPDAGETIKVTFTI